MNLLNQNQLLQNLSTSVLTSVVIVEDKHRGEFWVGCIIHKSSDGIFILTQSKFIKPNYQLCVHFHDNYEAEAEPLVRDSTSTSPFAVLYLYLEKEHERSTAIRFRDQPFTFSDAMCIIPKSPTTFQSISGFIPVPSCASNGAKGANQRSGDYFLFMAHQEDTPTITPAPVFHKDEDVNGFIIKDCSIYRDSKKVDVHMKICLKSAKVLVWLKKSVNQEDWKSGLELKSVPLKIKAIKNIKDQKMALELESKAAGKRPALELESKGAGKQRRR